MKVAIPVVQGMLCNHFGHCEAFWVADIEGQSILNEGFIQPPPHQPGVLPGWMADLGVNLVLAGGMGGRAIALFQERGVEVMVGCPMCSPQELAKKYIEGGIQSGANACDH